MTMLQTRLRLKKGAEKQTTVVQKEQKQIYKQVPRRPFVTIVTV